MPFPTPHLDKLNSTLNNDKLPEADKPRVQMAVKRYHRWIQDLEFVRGDPDEIISHMVALLNGYRLYIDVELIFDSEDDFLYRQKGQLKLDNSVVEEFLPRLVHSSVGLELGSDLRIGPTNCFSAVYFTSTLVDPQPGGGLRVRSKDQDFAITRTLYLRSSLQPDFQNSADNSTGIAYVAAEIKANLDKTMFQEACATAHDLKVAVPGANYFLLCEWLDMTPLSTAGTDIDEVLVLRGAKRLPANVRQHFSTKEGRKNHREQFLAFLQANPFRADIFLRFVNHIRRLLSEDHLPEEDVLKRGYF